MLLVSHAGYLLSLPSHGLHLLFDFPVISGINVLYFFLFLLSNLYFYWTDHLTTWTETSHVPVYLFIYFLGYFFWLFGISPHFGDVLYIYIYIYNKMYSTSGHLRCRWVCFFIKTDLEKFSITSLAHQWILCSEWVPSKWESKQLIKTAQ